MSLFITTKIHYKIIVEWILFNLVYSTVFVYDFVIFVTKLKVTPSKINEKSKKKRTVFKKPN
jgi:hypothetical protein